MIYFCPFVDELTKRERSIWWVYICMFILFPHLCKKGEKNLVSFLLVYLYLCIYVLYGLCTSLNIFVVYWYAWVKGELLWSLTLIHAYITPWVLSSSKRGRLLAQRLITLVLMMINSCSYSLLMILCLISFRYLIKILIGD